MSTPSPDAVRAEIIENALVAGNPVKTTAKIAALASFPMYVNSSSQLASGAFPFAIPVDVSGQATTSAAMKVTGVSTLSGSNDLGSTLVTGSAVTTFTATGYVRVQIVDAGGNVVDGFHYVQVGSLA